MAEWLAERTTDEAIAILAEAKIPAGPVLSPQQVLDDPHVREAGLFRAVDYPGIPVPAPLVEPGARFSGFALAERRPPTVGEHTDEVLAELGYAPTEIEALRAAAVV
jgi:crotonobetainyl-CoA:carnitine CoA-transferase CaiB-like acyl-CoA transferase